MKYLIRSVKYLVALCVLYCGLVWLVSSTSHYPITVMQYLGLMFSTYKGWLLVVATIILAATYPFFGFTVKDVDCDIDKDIEQILNAFRVGGYEVKQRTNDEIIFRASSPLSRFTMLFEDEIKLRKTEQHIEISGIRRAAVKIAMRLELYISNKRRHEEVE